MDDDIIQSCKTRNNRKHASFGVRVYWHIAKATWQEYLSYRLNFLLEVIGGIFTMLIAIAVWYAVFAGDNAKIIGTFTLAQMITYLLIAGVISTILFLTAQGDDINNDIIRGDVSNFLVKPINVPFFWLTRDFVRKFFTLILGVVELAIIIFIFRNYFILPSSILNLALFGLAIFLSAILHFLLFAVLSVIAFWFEETWGWRFVMRIVMEVSAGAIIPLSLFPNFWRTIFEILPFQYFIFFPMQIYFGKVDTSGIYAGFVFILAWLLILSFLFLILWKRGVRRYVGYGG